MLARSIAVAAAVLLVAVPSASARGTATDPPTRAQYVDDAESICRTHYRKTFRLLDRAGDYAGAGRLNRAGDLMIRAYRIATEANRDLRALERPPADAEVLSIWLRKNRRAFRLGVMAGKKLEGGHGARAKRLQSRASRMGRKANEKVAGFGFDHCV